MSTLMFSYRIAYKIGIDHTLFQLVYGLHPLLPIEYLLPNKLSQESDPTPIQVLTNRLSKLEKL
jgi:hypothetical protein